MEGGFNGRGGERGRERPTEMKATMGMLEEGKGDGGAGERQRERGQRKEEEKKAVMVGVNISPVSLQIS